MRAHFSIREASLTGRGTGGKDVRVVAWAGVFLGPAEVRASRLRSKAEAKRTSRS